MRRGLAILSALACLALLVAQIGALLEYALIPAPSAATTGPQGTADLLFGLMAGVGGLAGALLSLVAGIIGIALATSEGRRNWSIAIVGAGALAVIGLGVSAFFLLGASRNPYHPFDVFVLVPVTTIAYVISTPRRNLS